MTIHLTDRDVAARFAELTAALDPSPPDAAHRRLVIQGDLAMVPGEPVPAEHAGRVWLPLTRPYPVLGAGGEGHTHWLIPQGPGVRWQATPARWLIGRLHVPDGVTVLVHHDAVPLEHDDLLLGAGTWGARCQLAPDGHLAEQYRQSRWSLPVRGDGLGDAGVTGC